MPRVGIAPRAVLFRGLRPPTNFPVLHFTLPRVGFALNWVGLALRANLAASGRDSTTCCPSYLSRAPLAGRGKASPCPPMQTRARRSHAPTLVAPRIARSAIPTSNNAHTTVAQRPPSIQPINHPTIQPSALCPLIPPCPHVPLSTCPLVAIGHAHLSTGLRPICTFGLLGLSTHTPHPTTLRRRLRHAPTSNPSRPEGCSGSRTRPA